jgi:hypothetical protein
MHIPDETSSTEHERQAYARNDDLLRTQAQSDISTQALIFKVIPKNIYVLEDKFSPPNRDRQDDTDHNKVRQ